jgi:hypothetical protein
MKSFGKEIPGKTRKEMGGVSTMLWLPRGYHSYTYLRRTVL